MSHRGPAGYGIPSSANPYGPGPAEEESGNLLDKLRPYTDKVEDVLDNVSEPIKP